MRRSEQQIRDEITLREASIADAQRELAAGELPAITAALIESRELIALEAAKEELASLGVGGRPARRRRLWLLVAGLGLVATAIIVLLIAEITPRQPGNSITGDVSLGTAQQVTQLLTEGQADVAGGNVDAALYAYEQVLALRPKNVPALTETGWLEFSAGSSATDPNLVTLGEKDLRKAIAIAPRNPAPRLYYAIVADSTPGNESLAKSQFEVFLTLKPSAGQLAVARPFLVRLGLPTS
jgi:hypothetical protein